LSTKYARQYRKKYAEASQKGRDNSHDYGVFQLIPSHLVEELVGSHEKILADYNLATDAFPLGSELELADDTIYVRHGSVLL
jgi:hypothetical protein